MKHSESASSQPVSTCIHQTVEPMTIAQAAPNFFVHEPTVKMLHTFRLHVENDAAPKDKLVELGKSFAALCQENKVIVTRTVIETDGFKAFVLSDDEKKLLNAVVSLAHQEGVGENCVVDSDTPYSFHALFSDKNDASSALSITMENFTRGALSRKKPSQQGASLACAL